MGKVIETVTDSIAIEILDNFTILTSKGNELHLYRRNPKQENVFETEVLDIKLTNKVHCIRKSTQPDVKLLLVYGEKEFALLEYSENYEFREFYRAELSDWISCGLFVNADQEEIVLLTAHSIILRFSLNVKENKCELKERVSCTDKSTLYCAHLYGKNWDELVVFAGNAFGELLIWQPKQNEENKEEPLKPKAAPLLHRISAHNGVIFSIDYDQSSQCLITTSDDRAIKWWKVEFSSEGNWTDAKLRALSSGYGHVARVFQGRIIKNGPNIYALSVGEDSYFCLWHKNGQLLFKRRQQYGATIWNFVYDNNTKTIYTIGSIGNLVAFGLSRVLQETQLPQKETLLPALTEGAATEYIAKIKFLNAKHLIGVTNQNNLMTSIHKGEEWLNWEKVPITVNFKCTVMEVFENRIAICGYKRLIILECQENSGEFILLHDEELLKSVIRSFVFFSKQQYLLCDDQGNCLIFEDSLNNKQTLELPKCKEPWLTTAVKLQQQQYIVISNRQGNLLLYQLLQETNNYDLKQIIKHPHGNLGATNLHCLQETLNSALIRSTGHDGALNIFSIDLINATMQTCSRQIIPVSWVEYIEKCYNDLDLYLGFNDNHFVAWCKEFDFLLQLPCGGGHRCWHFMINSKDFKISLAFIKNKRVRFYEMPLLNKELTTLPLAKRWHIAPCNIMEILPKTSHSSQIVVTAGDDNLLKVHTFNPLNGLKESKELHNHISNIRALKLLPLNDNEFLIFSGGGRAQLCVSKVNCSSYHINELINYTLKPDSSNKTNDKEYNFDPETRLMALDVKSVNKEEYEIYVGCSDGFIRHLKLNLKTMETQLQTQYFYGKCILQLKYLADLDLIIVAATDGLLKFYDSKISKCCHQLQHHSSGINGLAVLYNSSNNCLKILSGGDDQAVSYTELSVKNLDFVILNEFHKPYLHTAQVCASALSSCGLYGFTSGVDQMLHKLDLKTGEVVDSFYSCVADIKGVALADSDVCLLYGCGLQIYAFNC
ncbi:WD repeat-containing protein 6 [Lucilia sericata]|uniref:WD repeat-containing protein 6 n=1 Tax=Lucilia sericata TaxID=13632 RepID=UPI0018A85166|nr:WD repeat-containing protein 6 [Lucilia sericata]